jgi:hypothetical protein
MSAQERKLHPASVDVSWRSTSKVDDRYQDIGITFNSSDGSVIRLRTDIASAQHLSESIAEFLANYAARVQSFNPSGIPRVDVSSPDDGAPA